MAMTRQNSDIELASFISELTFDELPADAVRAAERAVVDTVGVTLPGALEGAGKVAGRVAESLGDGSITLFGDHGTASLTDAAFANATAGHGLDYDDVTWGVWHPSVPMVAPILSVAERERCSGRDAITAYVAGYETQVYLASILLPAHYERGWHATATFGTFGATAAVASLLGLDREQTRHALNAAASMPAGLKRNFGTMTKPMHAGQAARSGVTAGVLAAEGFTSAAGSIDGERGFCDLYSGDETPALEERPHLGERWELVEEGIQVKKYPCCYFTHPAIAATQAIADAESLTSDAVDSVTVIGSQGAADALHYSDPDTGLEAKFSMEYTVACGVARDRVGLAAFDDENVDDPTVQAVRERVSFEVDPESGYNPYETTVRIRTTDGQEFERVQDKPPGTPENPLSDTELEEKFLGCVQRAGHSNGEELYERLDDLRQSAEMTPIFELL
jgi:2-methylcitrate dehydratase PrpD